MASILHTRNGGFTWDAQISPAATTLYGLYVHDRARAVISGAGGVILTTTNGGNKWLRQTNWDDRSFVRCHLRRAGPAARLGRGHIRIGDRDH